MGISRAERDLKFAERLAKLLDTSIGLPGTRFRFGLDPIIGLFPFVGDIVTLAMSLALIFIALRHGAGGRLIVMMAGNILVDTIGGSIPVLGSIFDFFYKSNTKNLRLLKEHIRERKHTGSGKGLVLGALILLPALFIALAYLVGMIISGFFRAFPEIYNWIVELFS